MGGTICYAADLIPEIADDVINIDRAMRWGYGWRRGPFEMIDALGADRFIAKVKRHSIKLPRMLEVLSHARVDSFYRNDGKEYFGQDGQYHLTPPE